MATLKAPLLSLGASGQIAKTIVMSNWKGIKTAREYVKPANPRTPAQLAQRARMRMVTAAWKTSVTFERDIAAWNLAALVAPNPMSGANMFTSVFLRLIKENPNAFLAYDPEATTVSLDYKCDAIDPTKEPDSDTTYTLMVGTTPRRLRATTATAQSDTETLAFIFEPDVKTDFFCAVADPDGLIISGIHPMPEFPG